MSETRRKATAWVTLATLLALSDAAAVRAVDNTRFVNMVQDAHGVYRTGAHRSVLMRYPLGRIGLWSIDQGEIADCVSRGLRIYPCIGAVTNKDNSDWRENISGDPGLVQVTYRQDSPAAGSTVWLTVTPHVSCFKYRLATTAVQKAIVLTTVDEPALMSWNSQKLKWTNNVFRVIDPQTVELTIAGFRKATVHYYVRFSVPSAGVGTFQWTNAVEGATSVSGDRIGGYLKFDTNELIVAVAVSHTSIEQARKFMSDEFGKMDFEPASERLRRAWADRLSRVEAQGPAHRLKQLYTALYTIYANIIDVTDNPNYAGYTPLITIASSDYWQYVGGYLRCNWDMSRAVYPLLALIDPELLSHILNTYQAQFDRDGKFAGNWDPFADSKWDFANYAANIGLLAFLHGVPGVDYLKFKDSVLRTVRTGWPQDFFELGYVPAGKNDPNCGSHTLEHSTRIQAVAILAHELGDVAAYEQYYRYRTNYLNLFDRAEKRFRVRTPDGAWGPVKGGFFEVSGADWVFAVPHDPYGLFDSYGVEQAISDIESYVRQKSDFNDYKLIYEFLPLFADRADISQRLVRTAHIPKFDHLTMAEWIFKSGDQGCYYTGNAGPLACCILGLYWIPTSGASWLITTPSVDRLIIHGQKRITIQTVNNSPSNHFIAAIKLGSAIYPALQVSGRRLVSSNMTFTLWLTNQPAKLGSLYLSSTDGELLDARGDGRSWIEFVIDPVAANCVAKVYAAKRPASITLNGKRFENWLYDNSSKLVTLTGVTKDRYRVVSELEPSSGTKTKRRATKP